MKTMEELIKEISKTEERIEIIDHLLLSWKGGYAIGVHKHYTLLGERVGTTKKKEDIFKPELTIREDDVNEQDFFEIFSAIRMVFTKKLFNLKRGLRLSIEEEA